jgi:hypothetical protein
MKLALGAGAVLVLAAVSTSSAPAGGPLLCSARTLSARAGLQGSAGALEGGVTVTNRRPYPCTLSGRPGVVFLRGGFRASRPKSVRAVVDRTERPADLRALAR